MKPAQTLIPFLFLLLLAPQLFGQREAKEAEELLLEGDYAAAAVLYEELLAEDSSDTYVALLAECRLNLHEYDEARYWYEWLRERDQLVPVDRFNYGLVLKAFGRYDDARQQFLLYKEAYPEDEVAREMIASCSYAAEYADTAQYAGSYYVAERVEALNSPLADYSPVFYQDGLVFVSSRDASAGSNNPVTGQPGTDIYYAPATDNKTFGTPQLFSEKLNSAISDGPVTFTAGGDTIIFPRLVNHKGEPTLDSRGRNYFKLYFSVQSGGEWSDPVPFPIGRDDEYHYMHPSITEDGTRIFFTSDLEGGYGGFDLWASDFHNGKWGIPYNLGPEINTEGQEGYPYIHPDNTLYFSSDMHQGFGGYDVFRATQRYVAWGHKKNMRLGVNSSADDYGITFNPAKSEGYVSSNRSGGLGEEDVYFIFRVDKPGEDGDLLADNQKTDGGNSSDGNSYDGQEFDQNGNPVNGDNGRNGGNGNGVNGRNGGNGGNPEYLVVSGKVVEVLSDRNGDDWTKTQGDILDNALIVLLNHASGKAKSSELADDGRFSFEVENPENYVIIAKKSGYFVSRDEIQLTDLMNGNDNITIKLEKIVLNEANPNDRMPNVQFGFDSYQLDNRAVEGLKLISRILRENPEIQLELAGHACPIGPASYNQVLSKNRSQAVADFLVAEGEIPPQRLDVNAYGENDLLYENPQTELEYALNRRTEFIVRSVGPTSSAQQDVLAEVTSPRASPRPGVGSASAGSNRDNVTPGQGSVQSSARPVPANVVGRTDFYQPNEDQSPIRSNRYTVKRGDTLFSIARRSGNTVTELQKANNLENTTIYLGQTLQIP